MKQTRYLSLILLVLFLLLTFSSCGSDSDYYPEQYSRATAGESFYYDGDFGFAEEAAVDYANNSSEPEELPNVDGRKIIYACSFTMQTTEYEQATAKLEALVSRYGAYFENADAYGTAESASRHASYTVRVPVKNYEAFRKEAAGIAVVVASGQNNEDVTEQYFDSEARLESAKLRESRLLEILAAADSLDDVLTLERELADVRYEIESYEGTLRKYDSLITYATVSIYLEEVIMPVEIKATPKTFGERVSQALSGGFGDFGNTLQNAFVGLCYALPVLLLWIVIFLVVFFIVRAVIRKSRKNYEKQLKASADNTETKAQ